MINKSPGGLSYHSNGLEDHHNLLRSRDLSAMGLGHHHAGAGGYGGPMGIGSIVGGDMSEPPEHYDLENASSIAPSDIDPIYHYRGYRDGNVRKYNNNKLYGGEGDSSAVGGRSTSHGPSPLNFPSASVVGSSVSK
jgi:hypothetical protein